MTSGKKPLIPLLILALGGLLFFSNPVSAQMAIYQHTYPKSGGSRISLTSPFSQAPTHGFQSIRVTINNGTAKDRKWHLHFSNASFMDATSNFHIPVATGQEITLDLLVPVPWQIQGIGYRQENIRIRADGLGNLSHFNSSQFNGDWPNIVISEKLTTKNLSQLNTYLEKKQASGTTSSYSSPPPFAASFKNKSLPSDWRAYIGYDAMMITANEWIQLRPAVQKAILEWNRFGGLLQIYTAPADRKINLRSLGFDRKPFLGNVSRSQHSYGSIELHGWDGETLKLEQTYNTLKHASQRRTDFETGYTRSWALLKTFGIKKFNPLLVILILTLFSILVGPVNLFVFAKQGRRHRLFITTPIISIVASIIVMSLILFKDGLGGEGRRMLVMDLESSGNEKRAYITQEQISRTGVLLGKNFQLQDNTFISQVQLPDSPWSHKIDYSNSAEFLYNNDQLNGDWFRSRTEQGQVIQSVRPTRSRIEITAPANGDQPPRLFSSLEFSVEQFFYVGDGGRIWKAKTSPIPPGSEIILEASTRSELSKQWIALTDSLSSNYESRGGTGNHSFRRKTRDLTTQPGHFFAVSHDPGVGFIATLDAINWTDADALIFGPVIKRSSSSPSKADDHSAK